MTYWFECRNCSVLKAVGHASEEEAQKCRDAIGKKYGWFAPGLPFKSLWVCKKE